MGGEESRDLSICQMQSTNCTNNHENAVKLIYSCTWSNSGIHFWVLYWKFLCLWHDWNLEASLCWTRQTQWLQVLQLVWVQNNLGLHSSLLQLSSSHWGWCRCSGCWLCNGSWYSFYRSCRHCANVAADPEIGPEILQQCCRKKIQRNRPMKTLHND